MLVIDTSAFVSLAIGDVLDSVFTEFDVVTTQTVFDELEQTAEFNDRHGRGAAAVIDSKAQFRVIHTEGGTFVTSRIDDGEASCVAAVRTVDAVFLITDDFRALPELQQLVDADVALSPIVLRAVVKRGALTEQEAKNTFKTIADGRDWLEAPIYHYARHLFE